MSLTADVNACILAVVYGVEENGKNNNVDQNISNIEENADNCVDSHQTFRTSKACFCHPIETVT